MSTISDLTKAAAGRCWDGYEPVPGKDAYSDDSCRKIGSKKKKKKSGKKATIAIVTLEALPILTKRIAKTLTATTAIKKLVLSRS